MFSITSGVHCALITVGLLAFATASLVQAVPTRALGGSEDADGDTYMHLLQINADKRQAVQPGIVESVAAIKVDRPYYHTTKEIQNELKLMSENCDGAMTLETRSDSGVDIDVVRLRDPNSQPVNKVFLLFGEHSRELISPESGLRFLQLICGRGPVKADREHHHHDDDDDLKADILQANILADNEFQIVLNGNPHSRTRVEEGEFCLRTNPNGVDLNRNWDEMWGAGDNDMSDTNAGPRPFSEPETRIFKKLVEEFEPTTFLTVHSGTRGLYMPWAYDMEHTASYNAPLMLNVLKDLDKAHCQCPYGAAGREVGYPCPGTCLDWVYSKLKTPYVFAFEIYTSPDRDDELKARWDEKKTTGGLNLLQSGGHLGHEHFQGLFDSFASDFVQRRTGDAIQSVKRTEEECFAQFNPETEEGYNKTVQNWAVAYLEMATMIAEQLKKDPTILQEMNKGANSK